MTAIRRTVVLSLAAFLLVGRPSATAQKPAESILEGVDSVDATISLTWDSRIENPRESSMQSRLETVFELELRQRGIVVSKRAPNYLDITMTALSDGDGTVSYNYVLLFYEKGLPERVLIDLWVKAGSSLDYKRLSSLQKTDSVRARLEMHAGLWDGFMRAYRDSAVSGWVVTWLGSGGVGHVRTGELQEVLERKTRELAQQFANAYIAAHPKR